MVKKMEDMFIRFDRIYERDRQTDRQPHRRTPRDGIGRICIASRGQKQHMTNVMFSDSCHRFEILRHQQPLWVSTQTGIKRRSKILELELLQEQSILTIKQ